ncbi:MAG: fliE [Symbiobacteriaceae bacterium]|jgi:flagellar hook-basal body complex protein FliE|nr:fliE [Symbiobacteriaceae bacterium]
MDIARLSALLGLDQPVRIEKIAEPAAPAGPDFGQVLKQAVARVEQDQKGAADAAARLVTGEAKDLSEVMIASERANLSLGLALQVRNKMLEAYQEIMRMPL